MTTTQRDGNFASPKNLCTRKIGYLRLSCLGGFSIACAVVAGFVTICGPADATTLVNRDNQEHRVTVIRGKTRHSFTLTPKGEVSDICIDGCIVRLNDDVNADYILEGNELVSVEDGLIYFERELGARNPIEAEPKAAPVAPQPANEPSNGSSQD